MPGTCPGVNTLSACWFYKRETALLSTKFFHEGNAAKPRRNVPYSLGRRMSFRLLSLPLFIPLPLFSFVSSSSSFFFILFSVRSLNWSAFRRQSKSNQTLTSITNAPWAPVKPRISTISVFRRTADNSGFYGSFKNFNSADGSRSKERHIGIKHDKPLLLVGLPCIQSWNFSRRFTCILSAHFDPTAFSFHPAVQSAVPNGYRVLSGNTTRVLLPIGRIARSNLSISY